MKNDRRKFLKLAGLTGVGLSGGSLLNAFGAQSNVADQATNFLNASGVEKIEIDQENLSIIGLYGAWASAKNENKLPSFSFRRAEFKTLESWKKKAMQRALERLAVPDIGSKPAVTIKKKSSYDGLS